jgi:rsbT co-antagonist protein RsbR
MKEHCAMTANVPYELQTNGSKQVTAFQQRIAELEAQVAAHQQTEAALMASEAEYRLLAENATDMISRHAPDGTYLYVSAACRAILGFEPIDLLGTMAYDLFHPEDLAAIRHNHQETLEVPDITSVTYRIRTSDDQYVWVETTSRTIRNPQTGAISELQCATRNVEARMQAEAALLVSNRRINAILESITDAFFAVDNAWRFTYINHQAGELLFRAPEELPGKVIWEEFPDAVGTTFYQQYHRAVAEQTAVTFEEYYPPFDIWFEVRAYPSNDGLSVYFHDISERRRLEAEHKRLQDEIIQSQAAILAEMSTPLIPLSDEVVVMPLIGTIDTQRAQQIMENLLTGISQHRAAVAILDITGVRVVDTQVANALVRAAQAAKLLGAQVILTGMHGTIAQTLVHLGADLSGLITRSTLQNGITYALGQKK